MSAPIAVAIDAPDLRAAKALAAAVAPHVAVLKLGLEFFCAEGPAGVEAVRGDYPIGVFLDLKLHDIPATVAGAARAAARLRPDYLTVHASGGTAMISAAAEAAPDLAVAAVTILTSLSADDLRAIGMDGEPSEAVVRLATVAVAAGARALVCSPQEVRAVRDAVGPAITLITPGVRLVGGESNDQARVATPQQALADGADLLVIGRPITAAADPGGVAAELAAQLALARNSAI